MRAWLKLCLTVYWLSLAVWLAVMAAAGLAAGHTFGKLPGIPMVLEEYAAYPAAEHGRIAAGLVMALFVVSRALGLLRQMVISHQFGTSGELDAYLAAFRLPDILFQLVAGGALASAFIPTFSAYLAQGKTPRAWRLASAIINLVLILTVALGLLGIVLAPWLVSTIIAPGFDAEQQALTVELMRLMLSEEY